jgi:hypothetical protein
MWGGGGTFDVIPRCGECLCLCYEGEMARRQGSSENAGSGTSGCKCSGGVYEPCVSVKLRRQGSRETKRSAAGVGSKRPHGRRDGTESTNRNRGHRHSWQLTTAREAGRRDSLRVFTFRCVLVMRNLTRTALIIYVYCRCKTLILFAYSDCSLISMRIDAYNFLSLDSVEERGHV